MARLGRYFLPDQPLHAIQRGNNRDLLKAYRELFRTAGDADFADALRAATNGGWAHGDARFKRQIAEALDRQGAQPPGCAAAEGPTAEAEAASTAVKSTLTPFSLRLESISPTFSATTCMARRRAL
jgi:hypothetical protein